MSAKYLRISKIIQLASSSKYESVWDLCCDHGLIGMGIYRNNQSLKIKFVDQIKTITDNLIDKIKATYITIPENINIINDNILKLTINSNQKNLYILSGIGGYLSKEMILKITKEDPGSDILICAHQNIIELRKFLSGNSYPLVHEELLFENRKFYEIILIKAQIDKTKEQVTNTGSLIWEDYGEHHQGYIVQQVEYLKKATEHKKNEYLLALRSAYELILQNNKLS